jgi:hypothetical protein
MVSQNVPTIAGNIPPSVIYFFGDSVRNDQEIILPPLEIITYRNRIRNMAVTAMKSLRAFTPRNCFSSLFVILFPLESKIYGLPDPAVAGLFFGQCPAFDGMISLFYEK